MMIFLRVACLSAAVAVSSCFVACAPKAKPIPLLPVPQTVDVTLEVGKIRPGIERASDANAALKATTTTLGREAKAARAEADLAVAEAKRLVLVGAATSAELGELSRSVQGIQARNLFLEIELEKQADLVETQSIALNESRNALADALAAASTGDAAQRMLSQQIETVTGQYVKSEQGRQDNAAELAVLKAEVERLRRLLFGLGLACAGYVVLRLLKLHPVLRPFLFWIP